MQGEALLGGVHADRPSKALETSKTTLHFGAGDRDLLMCPQTTDFPAANPPTFLTSMHPCFAFQAVYEHRDFSGKPRLIGSTDKVPEQQFELDWTSDAVKSLRKDGMRSELVWAAAPWQQHSI